MKILMSGRHAIHIRDEQLIMRVALQLCYKENKKLRVIFEVYAALLLAFLSCFNSKHVCDAIVDCLSDGNMAILVLVLDSKPELNKKNAFHLMLNLISPETHTVVSEVIESCMIPKELQRWRPSLLKLTPRFPTGLDFTGDSYSCKRSD